jgi:hypothetical protein
MRSRQHGEERCQAEDDKQQARLRGAENLSDHRRLL